MLQCWYTCRSRPNTVLPHQSNQDRKVIPGITLTRYDVRGYASNTMLERLGALVVGPIAKISVIRVLPYPRSEPFPYIPKHILSYVDNLTWHCLIHFYVVLLDVYRTDKRLTLVLADGRLNGLVLHRQLCCCCCCRLS